MRPAPLRFTSPRWGEVDLLLAMPTGRANARRRGYSATEFRW